MEAKHESCRSVTLVLDVKCASLATHLCEIDLFNLAQLGPSLLVDKDRFYSFIDSSFHNSRVRLYAVWQTNMIGKMKTLFCVLALVISSVYIRSCPKKTTEEFDRKP